jgi:prefoldin subunit 5
MCINIMLLSLKAFAANELLQKEKGNLEKECQMLEKKYHKVSTELLSVMQELAKFKTEKQVCAPCVIYCPPTGS